MVKSKMMKNKTNKKMKMKKSKNKNNQMKIKINKKTTMILINKTKIARV